ncbi:glutamyl-tRNA reductase [Haloglycomyces albus]|uniref:glutamyl-tRNA reductase n=1 Tax=Haloglycomyces albus TaxID=526067 RepID=UPI00046D6986|nr:glutamyl-tRNA reductase [Haloglycomyces albus]
MNLLVVGLSHHSAPISALEQLAFSDSEAEAAVGRLIDGGAVSEAVILSTCNRVEVYASAPTFHGALTAIVDELQGRWSELDFASVGYARHNHDAIDHLFRVVSGLDSIAAGEAQILGQIRTAYDRAVESDQVDRQLHDLFQRALHTGKRVRTETDIEDTAPSIITAALQHAGEHHDLSFEDARVVVLGAGAMGALAAATVARYEPKGLTIVNRDPDKADALAREWQAESGRWEQLGELLPQADLLITATGAPEPVVDRTMVSGVSELLIVDVALPRDTTSDVSSQAGVEVIDLGVLHDAAETHGSQTALSQAEEIIRAERDEYLERLRAEAVTPTVAALRGAADDIVTAELEKLARRDDFTDAQRATVAAMVRRVVGRLLHEPTVRVRQLAGQPGAPDYAQILNELFALDCDDLASASHDVLAEALKVRPVSGPAQEGN